VVLPIGRRAAAPQALGAPLSLEPLIATRAAPLHPQEPRPYPWRGFSVPIVVSPQRRSGRHGEPASAPAARRLDRVLQGRQRRLCVFRPALFDKPTQVARVPLSHDPQDPQAKARVSCFYYPHFMVKEIDLGEQGAEQLSIVPLVATTKPGCRRENAVDETVIAAKRHKASTLRGARRRRRRCLPSFQRHRLGSRQTRFFDQDITR
jgi:hypothetical protein